MLQAVPKSKCQWNELKCQVVVISHCIAAKHLLVVRCLAQHQERLKMASSLHQVRFASQLVLLIRQQENTCSLLPLYFPGAVIEVNDSFDCARRKHVSLIILPGGKNDWSSFYTRQAHLFICLTCSKVSKQAWKYLLGQQFNRRFKISTIFQLVATVPNEQTHARFTKVWMGCITT